MINIKKNYTKIILLLLFGICVVVVLIAIGPKPSPPLVSDPEKIQPLPIVPVDADQEKAKFPLILDQRPEIPSSASFSIYSVSNAFDPEKMVSSLFFAPTDLIESRTTEDRRMWSHPEKGDLTILSSPLWHVYYQAPLSPEASPPNKLSVDIEQIRIKCSEIIGQYFQPYSSFPITIESVDYLNSNGYNLLHVTEISRANSVAITLKADIHSVPFYTNTRPLSVGTITLNADGSLNTFTYSVPPQISSQQDIVPISTSEAFKLLRQGKATLISTFSSNQTELSFKPALSTISVDKIETFYLYLPQQNRIVPSFLFYGKATNQTDGAKLDLKYIVPMVQ